MGAIRSNSPRPTRRSEETRTEDAAKAARAKGLLQPGDVKRMTDGTVSFQDLDQAKRMVANAQKAGDADQLKIAKELESAVMAQIRGQGLLPTMMETARDERAQAAEIMGSVRDRFEAHRRAADAPQRTPQLTPEQQQMKDAVAGVMQRMMEMQARYSE